MLRGHKLVASIDRLARDKEPPTGPLRQLKAFFAHRDVCLVGMDGGPILPAPAALGMLLIIAELVAGRRGGAG